MAKLPKRKAAVCTEHHKACKCREKAFNILILMNPGKGFARNAKLVKSPTKFVKPLKLR